MASKELNCSPRFSRNHAMILTLRSSSSRSCLAEIALFSDTGAEMGFGTIKQDGLDSAPDCFPRQK